MVSTIFISKVVQWDQYVHVHIPTFSWETRKNFTYTLILEKFPHFTVDLWTNDCSEISEVIRHFKDLKDAFIKWSCKSETPDYHFERAIRVHRKALLHTQEKGTQENLPLVVKRHQISKILLINTDIFFLLMKKK